MMETYLDLEESGALDEIHRAIREGSVGEVRAFLARWPFLAAYAEFLIAAIAHEQKPVLREFLAAGNGANHRDETGDTPLMSAAAGGDLEIVRTLVEMGADPDALVEDVIRIDSGRLGESALYYALKYGNTEVADYLMPLTSARVRALARKRLDEAGPK